MAILRMDGFDNVSPALAKEWLPMVILRMDGFDDCSSFCCTCCTMAILRMDGFDNRMVR